MLLPIDNKNSFLYNATLLDQLMKIYKESEVVNLMIDLYYKNKVNKDKVEEKEENNNKEIEKIDENNQNEQK